MFLLVLSVLTSIEVRGQMILFSEKPLMRYRNRVDTSVVSLGSPWNAVGMVVGINLGVWGYDYYIKDEPWAHISWKTMRNNIQQGFVWDNDKFTTNLFLHPYHGGLYFNAARSNGNSYWKSVPYSLGGSLMWEFLMENSYPSINDFIATGIGGTGLGELTFRLSDQLIDERSRGLERVGRELATFVVSPVRSLNRLINGRSWVHSKTRGNVLPPMPMMGYVRMGQRKMYNSEENFRDIGSVTNLNMGFTYGNPYDDSNDKPFDYFSGQLYLNLFSCQPVISKVKIIGMLYSNKIPLSNTNQQLTWGVFQHYSYFETVHDKMSSASYPYKLSEAASFGPGLLYRQKYGRQNSFCATVYVNGILLGGSQTDYYNVYERDYNLGNGYSTKLNLEWLFRNRLAIRLQTEDYHIFTWLGKDPYHNETVYGSTQGDRSNANLSFANLGMDYMFNKHLFVELEAGYFYRSTIYKHYPSVFRSVLESSVNVGWLF
jgi:hypothetical protein